jgi:hypothetical protein
MVWSPPIRVSLARLDRQWGRYLHDRVHDSCAFLQADDRQDPMQKTRYGLEAFCMTKIRRHVRADSPCLRVGLALPLFGCYGCRRAGVPLS